MKGRWAALAGLLVASTALGQPVIDVSKGVIGGRTAVSFWPADTSGKLLDPVGFSAYLITEADPYAPLEFPCGSWVAPPPGRYAYWLEGSGWISPSGTVLGYAGSPFRGKGLAAVRPVVPAGRVALAAGSPYAAGVRSRELVLRLLHTDSQNRGSAPKPEMARQAIGEAATEGVQMPEGDVVAGIFDWARAEYLALARPVRILRNELALVDPLPPAATADLVVVLERPELARHFDDYDVALELMDPGGEKLKPDVTIPSAGRLFAIWYGLTGRRATLTARSPSVFMEPQEIVLRAGRVERYQGLLRPKPSLDVHIDFPPELDLQPDSAVRLLSLSTRQELARHPLTTAKSAYRFERVPPGRVEVDLDIPPTYLLEKVDLSDGESAEVFFRPEPIFVSGTIYRGSEPTPARVRFSLNRGPRYDVTAYADETGRYEAVLYRAGAYLVSIATGVPPAPAYVTFSDPPILGTTVRDFHLPTNRFTVKVLDGRSGMGIRGAIVSFFNRYPEGATAAQTAETDEKGRADLAPLRPGELTVRAQAEGFEDSAPVVVPVTEVDSEREIEVRLKPLKVVANLALLLPTGVPAADADVLAVASIESAQVVWRGSADSRGEVELPNIVEGATLLVKHPAAGFLIRSWRSDEDSTPSWTLPPAGGLLQLRVERTDRTPAPWARLTLWIDGQPLSASTLHWLTGASTADVNGFWRGANLPAGQVEVVARESGVTELVAATASRSQAIRLAYPWPPGAAVTAFR